LQFVCLLLIDSLLAVGCARAADEALINAAKKEGQVVWYTTQIVTQFVRPAAEAFQKKYGIKVNFLRGDSVETAVRLLNEGRAGKGRADVFDGTTTLPALKRERLVLKWLPDELARGISRSGRLLGRHERLCAHAGIQHDADPQAGCAAVVPGSPRLQVVRAHGVGGSCNDVGSVWLRRPGSR
jgi:hypothetical protein